MNSYVKPIEPPFASEGGIAAPTRSDEDPYQTLDDLMAAIEMLCPRWPQRRGFADGPAMLL